MAKLRTRKWLLSAFASLTGLLVVGFYALAQAPDEGKRDRTVAVTGGTFHALPGRRPALVDRAHLRQRGGAR